MTHRPHRRILIAAAIAGATLLAFPVVGAAQHRPHRAGTHRGEARPVHVTRTTSPRHSDHRHDWAERRVARHALDDAGARAEAARNAARPFDEAESELAVERARSSLGAAAEAYGAGRFSEMYDAIDYADRFVADALRRVESLADELDDLRREAERTVVRLAPLDAGRRWSWAATRAAEAESELGDGERALVRGDYTDARGHYAAALEAAHEAEQAWRSARYDHRGHDHQGQRGQRGHRGHRGRHGDAGHRGDCCGGDSVAHDNQGRGARGGPTLPVACPLDGRGFR